MKNTLLTTALAVSFGAAPLASNAAITVMQLDETKDGFTTATTPILSTGDAAGTANDNKWGFGGDGNGYGDAGEGTTEGDALSNYAWIAQSKNASEEPSVPDLAVAITGLNTADTYNIYGYYAANESSATWGVRLGLNGGGLTAYFHDSSNLIAGGNANGGTELYRVLLGTVDSTTTATVDVAQLLSTNADYRSIVKGVGIEVVPEPSSAALLGLGGLALILRRRK